MRRFLLVGMLVVATVLQGHSQPQPPSKTVSLPTSKLILAPVPGSPQRLNGFPASIAVSPDGKYLATLNAGWGTEESKHRQSIAILDVEHNTLVDFPEDRLGQKARQTYFLGLAFSADGKQLYAPFSSITDPTGEQAKSTGNGIAVYSVANGKLAASGFLKIPLQKLANGVKQLPINRKIAAGDATPFPAGIALFSSPKGPQFVVADNLSDDALILDAATGKMLQRFDLSSGPSVPVTYPYTAVATRGGRRAYVSLWNASQVVSLDLAENRIARKISVLPNVDSVGPGSHPTALLLSPDERFLYVALANADRVAIIDVATDSVLGYLATEIPGQRAAGTYPNALAESADGKKLFVANASSNAIAVFDLGFLKESFLKNQEIWQAPKAAMGFVPTEWYPTALGVIGNELFVATAKGHGTGSNQVPGATHEQVEHGAHAYIAALLHGSLARIPIPQIEKNLSQYTEQVVRSNLMRSEEGRLPFRAGKNPIKHVIYIIKENRTYDQILGDLGVGDGDPKLTFYGEDITPNLHKIARQFGVIDNFYDSGEVSGDGHVWSNAAITSDYNERTWQISYRSAERTYDYEGNVSNTIPLEMGIPDINEPGTGFLWTTFAKHGISYRHYGEYVESFWCKPDPEDHASPMEGTPHPSGVSCPRKEIQKGEPLPGRVGNPKGGPSPWPWAIPVLGKNTPTKPELRGHFDPEFPDFQLNYPDQLRADEFINEFDEFVAARKSGSGAPMPQFILLRLPNDHTSGARAGAPTPAAQIADNDLAVGRVVEAVSHSPFWEDTAIFIVEDDAQNGVDHVDAHRSTAFVISKYSPRLLAADGSVKPFVDHHSYTTVSMVRTMEVLLGAPPMNNNDAKAPLMEALWAGGDQPAFTADTKNLDNGFLYQLNPAKTAAAAASAKLDFSHADAADAVALNTILWRDRMGNKPEPKPVYRYFKATKDKD